MGGTVNQSEVIDYITTEFDGVTTTVADENLFFFYDPAQMFPFATLMVNDANDEFSDLNRPGVYRLNIGVDKETFVTLVGDGAGEYDYTAFDTIMPHPVYGRQRWISILNPSDTTFAEKIHPLLADAYARDVRKHTK
ncbi:hypothetical protein SE17_13270 [Kouleothrix aurantiaca]|uniref:DUF6194 domain-containing protein n=1 Tax=Kouleothrix aurantiaca TaxID=186479 RepID=A0A0P9HDT5_9CHLR|nr:hypothetical protein SE17_13270 [Kouleothrix aurantiaca]